MSRYDRIMKIKYFRIVISLGICLTVFTLAGARFSSLASAESVWTIQPVVSPAGANSTGPQFTVRGDRVILSWLETSGAQATLKFAERTPSGWSTPQTVSSGANFFVNAFDVPSVHELADGTLAANWLVTNGPDPDASKVRLSWSKDHGHTWSRPVSPHHDNTQTEHGFVSMFQSPGAGLGLVWIDGRETNPEKETGDMSLRSSVYDRDGKQLREIVLVPRVCECCSTAAAEMPDGLIVAFRGRTKDEVRDIHVIRYTSGSASWSKPTVVHDDNWKIDACPINGPAISSSGREVAVAWFTAVNDKGRAFVAFSQDAGNTFGQAIRVDDASSLGRLGVVMLADGSAAVTYIESGEHSQFRVRKISPAGVRSAPVTIAETSGGRYPRIARDRDELLFSWTEVKNGASLVKTARTSLSSK